MKCPNCGILLEDKDWNYRRKKISLGQCSRCLRNTTPGYFTCKHCRLEMRIYSRKHRREKK